MKKIAFLLSLLVSTVAFGQIPTFKVENRVISSINDNLFGQFLEKPSWGGEIGGDAVFDRKTGKIIPDVLKYLKAMNIPIIRFPGGTDVDYYPWYNLIDNVPGKHTKRPAYANYSGNKKATSDNSLGLDNFLNLSEKLHTEPLLVVNIGDAFFKNISIEEAAENAAAMVEYCNGKKAKNSDNSKTDWTEVRKKNGRKSPWHVTYFEIGNEPRFFKAMKQAGNSDSLINHYMDCLEAIANAMLAKDSTIKIITDGEINEVSELMYSRLGNKIDMLAYHIYMPWGIAEVKKSGEVFPLKDLSATDIWNAWVTTPAIDSITNQTAFKVEQSYADVLKTPYPIALTEWNWNGWWDPKVTKDAALNSRFAKGIGVAGFLNAMMRESDRIKMGCQSMLVGTVWDITAIRVDVTQKEAVRFFPTGRIAGFYSRFHGDKSLQVSSTDLPLYNQPFEMTLIKPTKKASFLDAVATKTKHKLFFTIINRNLNKDIEIKLDLSSFNFKSKAIHHLISAKDVAIDASVYEEDIPLRISNNIIRITIPKHSVSVFEFNLRK